MTGAILSAFALRIAFFMGAHPVGTPIQVVYSLTD